jgi:hypothetical protein
MAIDDDLRFVHEDEFKILKSRKSKRIREEYYESISTQTNYVGETQISSFMDSAFKTDWLANTPLGYVEHRQLWALDGEFGEWVLSHNAMIKINNILFSHAGLGPNIAATLDALNIRLRAELTGEYNIEPLLYTHERGPLRYDGHVTKQRQQEEPSVDVILENFGVDHIIAGHTPTGLGIVYPRFNGKLINVDSGISEHFGGYRSSLEIRYGNILIKNMNATMPLRLPSNPVEEKLYFTISLDQFRKDPPQALVDLVESYQ